jgi:hypothetical protein
MAQAINSTPTQNFIPIKEIRDGIVTLKDGSMRSILLVSSTNFALKSSDEQQSIIYQFQNFLNSLNFSIQIFIQSRRLDIRPYIALLENRMKEQTSDLMKVQMREYIRFIRTFTEENNIMKKTFFIVVPYSPATLQVKNTSMIGSVIGGKKATATKTEDFEEQRTQLDQRVAVVEQGIIRCGLRAAQLGTEELIEVYYKLFNPGDVEKPIPTAS